MWLQRGAQWNNLGQLIWKVLITFQPFPISEPTKFPLGLICYLESRKWVRSSSITAYPNSCIEFTQAYRQESPSSLVCPLTATVLLYYFTNYSETPRDAKKCLWCIIISYIPQTQAQEKLCAAPLTHICVLGVFIEASEPELLSPAIPCASTSPQWKDQASPLCKGKSPTRDAKLL